MSVTASTVGKRTSHLEESGTINGHRSKIDYEAAGLPIRVLFVWAATIAERERPIQDALDLTGVVKIRELMTGKENVHIEALGSSYDDIIRIAHALDEMGYTVRDEIVTRAEYDRPSVHFDGTSGRD